MSPEEIGLIGIVLLLFLFTINMPVGFSMLIVGFAGYTYLTNTTAGLSMLGIVPYATAGMYSLSVIPLFVMMGMFLSYGGIGRDVFKAVDTWMGHLRGGMAIATIGTCAAFAAVNGSATATAATIGAVALPEMKRYGYDDGLATACVAAGGTLGILIPPSSILVLYGILTEKSIGKLLVAGLLPGLLQALLFMITIYVLVRINPKLAPIQPEATFRQKVASLKVVWPVLVVFFLVMGGLYLGWFTPTEAAACGAFIALIICIASKRFSWKMLSGSLDQSARTTAMLFLILIGAIAFGRFLAVTRIPAGLSEFIAGLAVSKYVVMGGILALMVVLGCFIEGISLMVLTIPILYPAVTGMGFDPIWFGVLMVVMLNIGMVTPPVGMNVFVTAGVAKTVPLMTIFRGVVPLWIAMIVCAILLIAFPEIATFLPSLM